MKGIKLYTYITEKRPINQRFDILSFQDAEKDLLLDPVYKEGYFCLLLIEEGKAELSVDGEKAKVEAPIVVCGLPGSTWEWKHWENIKGDFICFEGATLMAGLKGTYSLDPIPFLNPQQRYPFIPLSEKRFKRLRDLSADMKECISEYPVHYDLLRAELWQFVFLTEKEYVLNGNHGRRKEQKNYLMEFIRLVNENYPTHHDTQFYASELNITPNYLNKITKSLTDISAFDYITNRIMAEAKVLLRLTDINVSELSYKLGYENPGYFIRLFKKIEGVTPLDFRKKGTL